MAEKITCTGFELTFFLISMKCYQPRIETQVLCLQNYNSVLNTLCSTVNVISSYTN